MSLAVVLACAAPVGHRVKVHTHSPETTERARDSARETRGDVQLYGRPQSNAATNPIQEMRTDKQKNPTSMRGTRTVDPAQRVESVARALHGMETVQHSEC